MDEKPAEARVRVREIVGNNPNLTASDVARAIGISRQRVSQILRSEGLELRRPTAEELRASRRGRRSARPPMPVVVTGGVPTASDHTTAGRVGELLVAADLLARGWRVYFPLVPNAGCDLVIVDGVGDHVERVEVRCGKRGASGQLLWNRPDRSKSDRRAVVVTGEPVYYEPPFKGEFKPGKTAPRGHATLG